MVDYLRFILALVIVFLSYLGSYVATFLLDKIGHLVSKTSTKLDDEIINALKRPVRLLFILIGSFYAVRFLDPDLKINNFSIWEVYIILGILLVAYTLKRIVNGFLIWYSHSIAPKSKDKIIDDNLFPFVRKTISIFIFLIALIIIFDRAGIEIGPLLAGLGVAGLAVALALQDTLSNFFSGVHILADKPIKINDYIKLENGEEGFVREIGWRSIRIEKLQGHYVIIPNAKLSQSIIINYSLPNHRERVIIEIGIDYSSNIEEAEKSMVQAVRNVSKNGEWGKQYIYKDFFDNKGALTVFQGFGDSALKFMLIYEITDYSKRGLVTSEINKEVVKLFRNNKINIPYPVRTIYVNKD